MQESLSHCPNPECNQELHPIGNYSFGPSRLSMAIRKYIILVLATGGICINFLRFIPNDFLSPLLDSLNHIPPYALVLPVVIIFLASYFFPKTTVISCHHCGHQSEHLGRKIPALTPSNKTDLPVPKLSKLKVGESTKSAKTTSKRDRSFKRRQAARPRAHTPFARRRW